MQAKALTNIERCKFEIRDIFHQLGVRSSLFILTISLGGIELYTQSSINMQSPRFQLVNTYIIFALEVKSLDNGISNILDRNFIFLTNYKIFISLEPCIIHSYRANYFTGQDDGINFFIFSQSPDKELG